LKETVAIKGNSIFSLSQRGVKNLSRTIAATLGGGLLMSLVLASPVSAASTAVDFGDAETFAVLAATGITHTPTGVTRLSGNAGADIGSAPTVSLTNPDQVTTTGTKYLAGEAPVVDAQQHLQVAYDKLVAKTNTSTISADLGGQIIKSGVHVASAEALTLTGTLILDAEGDPNAVFIFQAGTTLTTAADSKVFLTNQAQACNVVWQLGTSATLGTDSHLVGAIAAQVSITAMTGASIDGQLLALTGAVTLDQNVIVNDACVEAPNPPEPKPVTPPSSSSHQPPPGETGTVDGGVLPNTGSHSWIFALGAGIIGVALSLWAFARWRRRNQGHE